MTNQAGYRISCFITGHRVERAYILHVCSKSSIAELYLCQILFSVWSAFAFFAKKFLYIMHLNIEKGIMKLEFPLQYFYKTITSLYFTDKSYEKVMRKFVLMTTLIPKMTFTCKLSPSFGQNDTYLQIVPLF